VTTAPAPAPFLLVATGLRAEARVADGPQVRAIASGGDPVRLQGEILAAFADGARAVLSFGLASGLDPGLAPGSIVIADQVLSGQHRYICDRPWSERMRQAIGTAVACPVAGVDGPLVRTRDKLALHDATLAVAADMESHVAGKAAARAGLPFAVLRVVCDPAQRTLPQAALAGMRADGRVHPVAVLASLLRNPAQLPALLGVAGDARQAMQVLRRCRQRLGPGLGWQASPGA
jgi:adenosylhomocysteine nucleosidase